MQSRYYDPTIGRFINADDTEYIGASGTELSYNIFAYCENNAIIYTDPDGKSIRLIGTTSQKKTILASIQKLTQHKLGITQGGYVYIYQTAPRNSKYPKGDKLVFRMLKNGNNCCKIQLSNKKNKMQLNGSRCKSLNLKNAGNGIGSSSEIFFNNKTKAYVYETNKAGVIALGNKKELMPIYIILAHEMIHADRTMRGRRISGNGTYTYRKQMIKKIPGFNVKSTAVICETQPKIGEQPIPKEEFAAVGLRYNKPDDITENDIRKEHKLNLRGKY